MLKASEAAAMEVAEAVVRNAVARYVAAISVAEAAVRHALATHVAAREAAARVVQRAQRARGRRARWQNTVGSQVQNAMQRAQLRQWAAAKRMQRWWRRVVLRIRLLDLVAQA
eukprot:3778303-Prymnesium_polylepis.1